MASVGYSSQEGAIVTRRPAPSAMPSVSPPIRVPRTQVREPQNIPTASPANRGAGDDLPESGTVVRLEEKVRVCRVETVQADRFTAIFSEPGLPDQRVRFPRSRVAPSDLHLLREGAVLYWIIVTEKDLSGDLVSKWFVRFRRTPRLSQQQISELSDLADEAIRAGGSTPVTDEDLDRWIATEPET